MGRVNINFEPVWFDSLGAKSSCTLVRTPDVSVLIDPGVAMMQPSFPASWAKKLYWEAQGRRAIKKASRKADVIVISHYHWDHCALVGKLGKNAELYKGKVLWAKNPNRFINGSQWNRARLFFERVCRHFGKKDLVLREPLVTEYENPMKKLPLASSKRWGSYAERKRELLDKGRKWFQKLVEKYWNSEPWIPELKFRDLEVHWADGREIKIGKTRIKFSAPRFHGLEFDRVGWVFSTTIQFGKEKFLHTSDLEGVQIEDYKNDIIGGNPNVLVMDGPPTYLFGFIINRINLNRSIENLRDIIRKINTKLIILDHHLLREKRYRERLKKVYETADREGKRVITAAEYLKKVPVVLKD